MAKKKFDVSVTRKIVLGACVLECELDSDGKVVGAQVKVGDQMEELSSEQISYLKKFLLELVNDDSPVVDKSYPILYPIICPPGPAYEIVNSDTSNMSHFDTRVCEV